MILREIDIYSQEISEFAILSLESENFGSHIEQVAETGDFLTQLIRVTPFIIEDHKNQTTEPRVILKFLNPHG
jgi:hypothetical protein